MWSKIEPNQVIDTLKVKKSVTFVDLRGEAWSPMSRNCSTKTVDTIISYIDKATEDETGRYLFYAYTEPVVEEPTEEGEETE